MGGGFEKKGFIKDITYKQNCKRYLGFYFSSIFKVITSTLLKVEKLNVKRVGNDLQRTAVNMLDNFLTDFILCQSFSFKELISCHGHYTLFSQ